MKEQCGLCDEAYDLLTVLQASYPIEIEEVDIYQNDGLLEKFHLEIPVVKINDHVMTAEQITLENLEMMIKNYL